jgi:hypothetical protein
MGEERRTVDGQSTQQHYSVRPLVQLPEISHCNRVQYQYTRCVRVVKKGIVHAFGAFHLYSLSRSCLGLTDRGKAVRPR